MTNSVTGECLTKTQIAGRELQQRYLEKQTPNSLANSGKNMPVSGLSSVDGGNTVLQPADGGARVKAYGSPASRFLDITV